MTYDVTDGRLDPPADLRLVEELSRRLGVTLPTDHLDFLRQHNGGEGFIGGNYIDHVPCASACKLAHFFYVPG